jgi:hypothetical protein
MVTLDYGPQGIMTLRVKRLTAAPTQAAVARTGYVPNPTLKCTGMTEPPVTRRGGKGTSAPVPPSRRENSRTPLTQDPPWGSSPKGLRAHCVVTESTTVGRRCVDNVGDRVTAAVEGPSTVPPTVLPTVLPSIREISTCVHVCVWGMPQQEHLVHVHKKANLNLRAANNICPWSDSPRMKVSLVKIAV